MADRPAASPQESLALASPAADREDVSDLLPEIRQTIVEQELLHPRQAVVVAVSGGLDSMVLLDLLHRLAQESSWRLLIAHLNHRLRGRESKADQALVEATAERLHCRCVALEADVARRARENGFSLELAARQARHEFLARVARRHRCGAVALAHHANDQVETFFLRLLRGASAEGLAGMRFASPSPADARVQLIRPLLAQPRQALEQYARDRGLVWREDSSNAATDFLRNRLRRELLPWLRKEFQPGLDHTLERIMELLRADADFVGAAAQHWLDCAGAEDFAGLHVAVQRRALQRQLVTLGQTPDFDLVEALRQQANRRIMTKPGVQVWRDAAGTVHLGRVRRPAFNQAQQTVELSGSKGRIRFGRLCLDWRVERTAPGRRAPLPRAPSTEFFDAARVGVRISLRHWRPGDRFQPIGLPQPVKLQDLFTNLKVPRRQRHERVVATTAEGEPFWIEGLRISERFKLSATTRRRLSWRWQRLTSAEPRPRH
jgi:tRNA(Ile)-lysidine synthase